MNFKAEQPLNLALGGPSLFHRWVNEGLPVSVSGQTQCLASRETSAALKNEPAPGPFFQKLAQTELGQAWLESTAEDYPSPEDAARFQEQVQALQDGRSTVVITGQQPGFMGGPLYSLYKAATVIALARRRTAAGRATVPVFWAGDDDDDLPEAMSPLVWDPFQNRLMKNPTDLKQYLVRGRIKPCVGNLKAKEFSTAGRQWLNFAGSRSGRPQLGQILSDLWDKAGDEDWSWSRLFRRFLLQVFPGQGLIVVSGNDPLLHQIADPLYRRIHDLRRQLPLAAEERGRVLSQAGFDQPISDRSLHRHLFQAQDLGRAYLEPEADIPASGLLRPGVLLRSPVQDWLFQPAAVVVGPGELAYLRQVDPLYPLLGIERCPLVPRLFGWIVPRAANLAELRDCQRTARTSDDQIEVWAAQAAKVAKAEVKRILSQELGTDSRRAEDLANGRGRRWQRSLESVFQGEMERLQKSKQAQQAPWIHPLGKRQERTLASAGAAALWGSDLVEAMIEAADQHLELGLSNQWQEFVGKVDTFAGGK